MNGSGMGVIALTALGGASIVSTHLQSAVSSLAPTPALHLAYKRKV